MIVNKMRCLSSWISNMSLSFLNIAWPAPRAGNANRDSVRAGAVRAALAGADGAHLALPRRDGHQLQRPAGALDLLPRAGAGRVDADLQRFAQVAVPQQLHRGVLARQQAARVENLGVD